jgi:hypothetical protein
MRYLLLALCVAAGCSQKPQEVIVRIEEPWRAGLTDAQAKAIKEAGAAFDAILTEGMATPIDSPDRVGLVRLKEIHSAWMDMAEKDGTEKASTWYKMQLNGKTLKLLADDYRSARPL